MIKSTSIGLLPFGFLCFSLFGFFKGFKNYFNIIKIKEKVMSASHWFTLGMSEHYVFILQTRESLLVDRPLVRCSTIWSTSVRSSMVRYGQIR